MRLLKRSWCFIALVEVMEVQYVLNMLIKNQSRPHGFVGYRLYRKM